MDNNRSKDVPGPELKRPEDKDLKMASKPMETHVLSKHAVHELSDKEHTPLTSLGKQVVMASGMGGEGKRNPKGMGRSVAKEMAGNAKKRSEY